MAVWMVVCLEAFRIGERVHAVIHVSRPHLVESGELLRLVFVEASEEQARRLTAEEGVLRVFRVWDQEQAKRIEKAWTRRN